MKQCIDCKTKKPLSEFYKNNSACKECIKARRRKEYYSDVKTSLLVARVKYESPKAALRRVRDFMKRYE